MVVQVQFLPENMIVEAEIGEPLLKVAERAGVFIPTGCLMGSCHACEVEIEGGATICACIAAIPAQASHLTINLYVDANW